MKKYKLIISYDGTNFHGWQIQPDARTVAGEIKLAIEKIVNHDIVLNAASRTDAGVHSLGQTADFSTDKSIDSQKLLRAINALLPCDVAVSSIEEVAENFHSTFDAKGKHYRYTIYTAEIDNPLTRNFHWHYRYELDVEVMKKAAKFLVGKVDFNGLKINSGKENVETVRDISNINITIDDNELIIDVFGKSFMYKLVRSIVGLLVAAGSKKISIDEIPELLAGKTTCRRTDVAPPQGLMLIKVFY